MKITILDFCEGITYIFPYDKNIYDNAEDFFTSDYAKEYNLHEANCHYMVSQEAIIKII